MTPYLLAAFLTGLMLGIFATLLWLALMKRPQTPRAQFLGWRLPEVRNVPPMPACKPAREPDLWDVGCEAAFPRDVHEGSTPD